MNAIRVVLTAAYFACFAPVLADVKVNVNVKDGDTISGLFKIVATCESDSVIQQVEFYLNDELVGIDTSTPYEYTFDTIEREDGAYTLVIAAYAEDGSSQRVTFKLTTDNQIGLGAKHHTELGEEALREQKWKDAILAARVALKADAKYAPALIVMARANLGLGVFDEAQKYIEDAIEVDPTSSFAHDILSQIHVRKAIAIRATGDDPEKAEQNEKAAFKAAIDAHNKAIDLRLRALGPPSEANLNQRLALLFDFGQYGEAKNLLRPIVERDPKNLDAQNRMMYAQIRRGELVDAQKTFDSLLKRGLGDARTYAMGAVLASLRWEDTKADDLMQQALKQDRKSLFVRLCQAFVVLDRGKAAAAQAAASDLLDSGFSNPEVYYYLGRIYYDQREYEASRIAYENALLQNPALTEVHIARAMENLRSARATSDAKAAERYLRLARISFEIALTARGESPEALAGLALAHAFSGRSADAARLAAGAQVVGGQTAWVQYVCAAVYSRANQPEKARQAMDTAIKLSPEGIAMSMPTLDEAFRYMTKWGRSPVLVAP